MITHISQLDSDDRTTACQLIVCDPYAGDLAREYLDAYTIQRGSIERGTMELIDWLILAREGCGIEGVGHG